VYTTYKGFGSIRKKLEIYALQLKRRPGPGDRSMEAVMDRMPDMEEKIVEDGKEIPWYEGKNVHRYIIGGSILWSPSTRLRAESLLVPRRGKNSSNSRLFRSSVRTRPCSLESPLL
jgi:hypothetical protein